MTNCWICGAIADSREHLVKASDLRQLFRSVSPNAPLYFHDSNFRNVKLGSVKSNRVKSERVLCKRCNDTLTQPYDQDWTTLSAVLHRRSRCISGRNRIRLQQYFPGRSRDAAKNIHLYFAKLFGCRIAGENVPMDITPFAHAIRTGTTCPGLSLIFCRDSTPTADTYAHMSEIHAVKRGNRIDVAGWTYLVDKFFVEVIWHRGPSRIIGIKGSWHPESNGTTIKLVPRE